MSIAAIGNCGRIIGTASYFDQIRCNTFLRNIPFHRDCEFWNTARLLAERADNSISNVYDDLSRINHAISSMSDTNRDNLIKQIRSLDDVCRLGGSMCGRSGTCIHMLESISRAVRFSFFTERELDESIQKIKNNWEFSEAEAIAMVENASEWGISWAADGNEKKQSFLLDIEDGKGLNYLKEVLSAYQCNNASMDMQGHNGYTIGSPAYMEAIESAVFGCTIPAAYSAGWANPQYAELLQNAFKEIADTVINDLENALRINSYMTDENADRTRIVLKDLERCGASTSFSLGMVEKMTWYVGGDNHKIRLLQQKLNEIGITPKLTEDGIYGEKTLQNWIELLSKLEHGSVPTLAWTDLLQSDITGVTIGATTKGNAAGLKNAFMQGKTPYIRFDPPHGGGKTVVRGVKKVVDYNHVNFGEVDNSNLLYDWVRKTYDHYPLSDDAYTALSHLDDTAKVVRIGGKILAVAGAALDALELGVAVYDDLNDADRKLGKTTVSTAVSIGTRWGGAAAGAKLGALAGTLTGAAAPLAIPILSLVGGIAGAFGGDALGQWVVDITYVGE